MKRIGSLVLVFVMVFGLVSTALASDEADVAKKLMDYSIGMLKAYQMMYEVYGDRMEDTHLRNAYGYLMMLYGTFVTYDAENDDELRKYGISSNEAMYKLGGNSDVVIIGIHDIIMIGDAAYADYCSGKITRTDFASILMKTIGSAIRILDQ